MDSVRKDLKVKLSDELKLEDADREFANQVDNSAFALHLFRRR